MFHKDITHVWENMKEFTFWVNYTLKDKDSLLALMPRTFIQQNKKIKIIVKKCSLDLKNVLHPNNNNNTKKGFS